MMTHSLIAAIRIMKSSYLGKDSVLLVDADGPYLLCTSSPELLGCYYWVNRHQAAI